MVKRVKRLNSKQRAALRYVSAGMPIGAAARKAGYAKSTANRGIQGFCKGEVALGEFREALKRNLPAEELVHLFSEAAQSKKQVLKRTIKTTKRMQDGTLLEVNNHEYSQEPDHALRVKVAESVARIQGFAAPPVNIAIDARAQPQPESDERLEAREKRVRKAELFLDGLEFAERKLDTFGGELPPEVSKLLEVEPEEETSDSGTVQ